MVERRLQRGEELGERSVLFDQTDCDQHQPRVPADVEIAPEDVDRRRERAVALPQIDLLAQPRAAGGPLDVAGHAPPQLGDVLLQRRQRVEDCVDRVSAALRACAHVRDHGERGLIEEEAEMAAGGQRHVGEWTTVCHMRSYSK